MFRHKNSSYDIIVPYEEMFIVSFYSDVLKSFIKDSFKLFEITASSCETSHFFGRFGHKMIKLIRLFTYKLYFYCTSQAECS